MKIYSKIVINMATNEVIEVNYINYSGEIALCCGGDSTTVAYPEMSEEEKALLALQTEILQGQQADWEAMEPWMLMSMGLGVNDDGEIYKLTEDELIANMSEVELNQYELMKSWQERQRMALEGKLPISPALEQDLGKQEAQLGEALSQRLGSGWKTTTAGQQAMAGFKQRSDLVREEARRGELSQGGSVASGMLAQRSNLQGAKGQRAGSYAGRTGGLFEGYGALRNPYQQQRQGQFQASMFNAQNQGSSGFWSGMGGLAGNAMMAGAMYYSSIQLKHNIKTIDNPIEKVMAINGVEFDWKPTLEFNKDHGLTGHDVGVIAEELERVVPEAVPTADGYKAVQYFKIIPLLVEAIKSQQHEIRALKENR